MPNILSRRVFVPPNTLQVIEPGYRSAPDLSRPMAIVFAKARTLPPALLRAPACRPAFAGQLQFFINGDGVRCLGQWGTRVPLSLPRPPGTATPPPQVSKPSEVGAAEAPTSEQDPALIGLYQVGRACPVQGA